MKMYVCIYGKVNTCHPFCTLALGLQCAVWLQISSHIQCKYRAMMVILYNVF